MGMLISWTNPSYSKFWCSSLVRRIDESLFRGRAFEHQCFDWNKFQMITWLCGLFSILFDFSIQKLNNSFHLWYCPWFHQKKIRCAFSKRNSMVKFESLNEMCYLFGSIWPIPRMQKIFFLLKRQRLLERRGLSGSDKMHNCIDSTTHK